MSDTIDTIRPIRESELDERIDLLCTVHNPAWCPVIDVGDRIVSTLRIWGHLGTTPRHGRCHQRF